MTRRPSDHPIAIRLCTGMLGLAVLLTGMAIPVAAAEPAVASSEPVTLAPEATQEPTGSAMTVDVSPGSSPDPSPIPTTDASPTAKAAPATLASPTPPISVTARAGVYQAKVYWDAPLDDGGSPVTGYTATASPGGRACTTSATARSCYVTGLSNGASYTFTVTARTVNGTSSPSAPTEIVTPAQDSTPPVLVSTSVTPTSVSSFGGTATVTLRITDDLSGRLVPTGELDANPAVLFEHGSQTVGFTRAVNRIAGDEYDGVYRATISLPYGLAAGAWGLEVYPIRDNAGNQTGWTHVPGFIAGAAGAPTNATATADDNRQVNLTWDAPAGDGGNVITGYRVTASPGGHVYSTTDTTLSASFATWPADVSVTFTVVALNAAGAGATSAPTAPLFVPATPPASPEFTSVTGQAGALTAQWTAPADGGSPIQEYTLRAQPGGAMCTTAELGCTIRGLDLTTAYTVRVTATNAAGTSAASAASGEIVTADLPGRPGEVEAVATGPATTISWAAPASDGGAPVSTYMATVSPGGRTCTSTSSLSCVIGGLPDGTYTASVTASNAVGSSDASDPSKVFVVDTALPWATLSGPSGTTSESALQYRLWLSEPVVELEPADFAVSGSAVRCEIGALNGSGPSYIIVVTGCADGTVSLALNANSVVDLKGNVGPAVEVRTGQVTLDRTAPTTPAVTATLRAGASLSGTAVPITLTWRASTDAGTGLTARPYELYRSYCGGNLERVGTYAGNTTTVSIPLSNCSTEYLVQAFDVAGNASAFGHSQDVLPRLTQQNGAQRYGGAWATARSSSYSGGTAKYASIAGSSVTFQPVGRSVALVTSKAPARGKVKIYVDGAYQATVDLRSNTTQHRALVWQKSWSTQKVRTVKLVVAGTPGRPRVDFDAFVELW